MRRDIVVIGGSAGALDPLKQIIGDLPPGLSAAVVIVLHMAATAKSSLSVILNREAGLETVIPRDGDPLRPGYAYVPVPDHHTEITPDGLRLTRGPRINGVRPAIDVLFRRAASAFGPRVIGVVLSGGLDDGSLGLAAIRAAGGVGIVQSPDEAMADSMPRNAIALGSPDHVLPSREIGPMIASIVGAETESSPEPSQRGMKMEPVGAGDTPGEITGITCPDCHGSIWLQGGNGDAAAFTCRVGHSYSPEVFFEIQAANVENALWAGVRSLEEKASLAAVMASRAARFDDREAAERYEMRRQAAGENAETLRKLLLERAES